MGKRTLGLFVIVCAVAATVQPATAENWARFRGPNGTGIALDKNIPVKWSESDGILWKAPIPGVGNSSPIIWGDRIFIQSATEDGKARLLLCLNAADGKVVWSQSLPGARAKIHANNSLASATPATDGERVYAAFWDGTAVTLYAYDFKGNELWNRNLGTFVSQHGAGASPIVHDGKVFFLNDQDKDQNGPSKLLALDAKTGNIVWTVSREPYRASYSAPFVLEKPNGRSELIVATTTGIQGYDLKSGQENWVYHIKFTGKMPLRMVGSPVYSDGLIFAACGDGSGVRHFACIRPGDHGDVSKTNLTWETTKKSSPYVPCVLTSGEHLYFVNDQGMAECQVARTGKTVWSERLGVGSVTASPILVDGKIYTAAVDGTVFVFAAAPEFKLLARNSLGESVRASPAVANDRLYIRGLSHLFCIGKPAAK
jgi:outer membrane protein assembly factor BamB